MNKRHAERIVTKTHAKEMARSGKRKRGNSPTYLKAIAYLKGMKKHEYCEWCGLPGGGRWSGGHMLSLHHGIDWKHNTLNDVIFLCTSCHLDAHNGWYGNRPNVEKFLSTPRAGRTRTIYKLWKKYKDLRIEIYEYGYDAKGFGDRRRAGRFVKHGIDIGDDVVDWYFSVLDELKDLRCRIRTAITKLE